MHWLVTNDQLKWEVEYSLKIYYEEWILSWLNYDFHMLHDVASARRIYPLRSESVGRDQSTSLHTWSRIGLKSKDYYITLHVDTSIDT